MCYKLSSSLLKPGVCLGTELEKMEGRCGCCWLWSQVICDAHVQPDVINAMSE